MTDDLPIDIHSSKLLDWLISRRHCTKDWQKNVLLIREKINHAIQDMPESAEIVKLLQGSYINFFHCARIVEILRDTEKDTKNFLGYYSSQRMKDWQEIESLYRKDNLNLAESAQILQRLVQYEIPSLKRQITKSDQSVTDCVKKEKDYLKQADEGRKTYEKELAKTNLKGLSLRAELFALASDLPTLFETITKDCIALNAASEYYSKFREYLHQGHVLPNSTVVPILKYLIQHGSTGTVYQWKYGVVPSTVELPNYDLLFKADEQEKNEDSDDIDFGDDEGIDFGDEEADIDFGEEIQIDVIADDTGAVGEHVARGDDALGIVENPITQRQLNAELNELLAFLEMRKEDEERETAADLLVRTSEKRPQELANVSTTTMAEWIVTIKKVLTTLNDPHQQKLFQIRASPPYVEKLVFELEVKRGLEARYKRMASLMSDKQQQCQSDAAKATEELKTVVDNTRELQKQLEAAIGKKYDGRRVNIMGGINAALANTY